MSAKQPLPEVYEFGKNKIDFKALEGHTKSGAVVMLTKKEAMLLKLLVENKNEVVNNRVIPSFNLTPFVYTASQNFSDTLLNFETQTPIVPVMNDSLKALMHQYNKRSSYGYVRH